jgi:two-component system chemotaxis response regulator CheB
MNTLKVLVVDDSALFRMLLRNALHDIPGCDVVGTASNGRFAVEKIAELHPDLVTLDVEMPDMDGIAVLQELDRRHLRCKVLMVSRLTSAGAQVTTDALLRGAFDFILKPSGKDPTANREELRNSLAEKIAAIRESEPATAEAALPVRVIPKRTRNAVRYEAVIIGSSTGGPDALGQVIPFLNPNFPVPIIIVQHMPERFTASLAMRLNESSEVTVCEASEGLRLEKGTAVIACGGKHLRLERNGNQIVARLTEDPHEHNCRPAIDYTLRSAVEAFKGPLLTVILTGMGRDGAAGCTLVREHGGEVIAQNAESCVVFGMPKAVINAGQADKILHLSKIPAAIEATIRKSAE